MTSTPPPGPLSGIRVLDLSALGPGPFCSMLLADFGADVVTVERPQAPSFDPARFLSRGKRSTVVDLRAPRGSDVITRLADHADVLLESNRPGTMERRGLGPDVLCPRNPALVYTRLTGWGQDGPYSGRAGHDINYTAVAGTLGVIGDDAPVPPLALVGDLAGGSLMAAFGIVMALFERTVTGRGQVIDAAITDGAALLNTTQLAELNLGRGPGAGGTCSPAPPLLRGLPVLGRRLVRGRGDRAEVLRAARRRARPRRRRPGAADGPGGLAGAAPPGRRGLREQAARALVGGVRRHRRLRLTRPRSRRAGRRPPPAGPRHHRRGGRAGRGGPAPRLSRTPGRLRPSLAGRGADTRAVLAEAGFAAAEVAELAADGTIMLAD